jgi:hypothetical protein
VQAGQYQPGVELGAILQLDPFQQVPAHVTGQKRAVLQGLHIQPQVTRRQAEGITAQQRWHGQAPPQVRQAPAQRAQWVVRLAEQLARQLTPPDRALGQGDPG